MSLSKSVSFGNIKKQNLHYIYYILIDFYMLQSQSVKLSKIKTGNSCVLLNFVAKDKVDFRLVHLGFTKGTVLQVVGKSFANQTIAVKVRNSVLCLRKEVANKIFVRCL